MHNATRNPTRRNRNIGTAKSGRSSNNSLVIPDKWIDLKIFWERLVNPVFETLSVKNHTITLAVEPVRPGYVHAATPGDIKRLLQLIPVSHLKEVDIIVLRQPKAKEAILSPVWGRFVYWADLGRYTGPGIYLEALPIGDTLSWSKNLSPFSEKELHMLAEDGHSVKKVKRGYEIQSTPESVRATQLFRTLPHEFGHAVDYLVNAQIPADLASTSAESEYITDLYFTKPKLDKEEFANRYAREFKAKWTGASKIPFRCEYDASELINSGYNPDWFHKPNSD